MLHKLPNNNLISSGLILLAPTVDTFVFRRIRHMKTPKLIIRKLNAT